MLNERIYTTSLRTLHTHTLQASHTCPEVECHHFCRTSNLPSTLHRSSSTHLVKSVLGVLRQPSVPCNTCHRCPNRWGDTPGTNTEQRSSNCTEHCTKRKKQKKADPRVEHIHLHINMEDASAADEALSRQNTLGYFTRYGGHSSFHQTSCLLQALPPVQ